MNTFTSIAEPSRRDILTVLLRGEMTVGELVEHVGQSQPSVSKHLRVLREADLVTARIDGQKRWYALNSEPFQEMDEWLAPFRQLWATRLDKLGEHLDHYQSQQGERDD